MAMHTGSRFAVGQRGVRCGQLRRHVPPVLKDPLAGLCDAELLARKAVLLRIDDAFSLAQPDVDT
jgi:hypothetical protein